MLRDWWSGSDGWHFSFNRWCGGAFAFLPQPGSFHFKRMDAARKIPDAVSGFGRARDKPNGKNDGNCQNDEHQQNDEWQCFHRNFLSPKRQGCFDAIGNPRRRQSKLNYPVAFHVERLPQGSKPA
jgi:hypothetical protein